MKRSTQPLAVLVTVLAIIILAAWLIITSGIFGLVLDADDASDGHGTVEPYEHNS
ncbi:hypothetical protein I6E52_09395 [Salinibacterium sp. NG253]|uniref:hypothetical protein n=1 Tax=Salinibacterium sp. NG253 TaxID=2792039 RepID=UPI0018CEFA31|nr:hypothetical protein [Salinibacterium sp. NG253]MBH0117059.1 hypothetical protein [Salinibacterium sp. NG253]